VKKNKENFYIRNGPEDFRYRHESSWSFQKANSYAVLKPSNEESRKPSLQLAPCGEGAFKANRPGFQ
jgi:hypothetical protein